jgi:hypothetical protein
MFWLLAAGVRLFAVGSTSRCNTGVKSLRWGFECQSLTWPFVELTSYFVQISLRMRGQTNGPKVARSAGGDRDDLVDTPALRGGRLFAMAVSYAVSAWAIPSARAFTMESLSTGGNTTRFAEPDGPANNFGRGAQPFGPGGPMVQFGARQGQLTPFSRSPGSGYNSTPPEPYARPLGNGD